MHFCFWWCKVSLNALLVWTSRDCDCFPCIAVRCDWASFQRHINQQRQRVEIHVCVSLCCVVVQRCSADNAAQQRCDVAAACSWNVPLWLNADILPGYTQRFTAHYMRSSRLFAAVHNPMWYTCLTKTRRDWTVGQETKSHNTTPMSLCQNVQWEQVMGCRPVYASSSLCWPHCATCGWQVLLKLHVGDM